MRRSLCCVSVQAAQEAVQQVADSSKETVSTGKVILPLKVHDISQEMFFYRESVRLWPLAAKGMKINILSELDTVLRRAH